MKKKNNIKSYQELLDIIEGLSASEMRKLNTHFINTQKEQGKNKKPDRR